MLNEARGAEHLSRRKIEILRFMGDDHSGWELPDYARESRPGGKYVATSSMGDNREIRYNLRQLRAGTLRLRDTDSSMFE